MALTPIINRIQKSRPFIELEKSVTEGHLPELIGVSGIGAAIASGVIIGALEFYAVICILPAFYEGAATIYYKFVKPTDRKAAVQNLIILENGKLKTPKGAKYYTLPLNFLSREPMRERILVERILNLYILCGTIALILSIL